RALVNDPVVVFLDEPTLGLDPRGKKELLALVRRIASERHAGVVFCSHLLSEVEEICDDVVIMREGQVVAAGPVQEVLAQGSRPLIRLRVLPEQVTAVQQMLINAPGVAAIFANGSANGMLELQIVNDIAKNSGADVQLKNHILQTLLQANITPLNFDADSGSRLQDIFFQLTEEPRS
ncbi:MAG: hypothetical protein KC415_22275, partial [Anaerolineales bacterium]|nr:hypothetical protein [Anaerolineales bacterium]